MKVKFTLTNLLIPIIQVLANMDRTYFVPQSLTEHPNGTIYKKIPGSTFNGLTGQNPSSVQCAFNCFDEDDCTSIYMEDGACVFGLTSNAEAFEGEVVTPVTNQIVIGKRLF